MDYDYYRCPVEELRREVVRRGYQPHGSQDQLSEALRKDDDSHGSKATTVKTVPKQFVDRKVNLVRTAEFGKTEQASSLVGQRIVHWTMNTFFPSLQLFFESGLSCTIEGGQLPDATVGLDPKLRFRLTDCTHEENGHLVKTLMPQKFVGPGTSIGILEASVAQRTSIAVKQLAAEINRPITPRATILQEAHTVVGLRLEGMDKMAYIWAKVDTPSKSRGDKTWGDVRIAGLRDDVPVPFFGFPHKQTKAGGEVTVVNKESLIKDKQKINGFGRH